MLHQPPHLGQPPTTSLDRHLLYRTSPIVHVHHVSRKAIGGSGAADAAAPAASPVWLTCSSCRT